MSQETVEAVRGVRIPLVPERRRHRTPDERILVTTKLSGHGTGSGVSISQQLFQFFTVRQGLAIRQADYLSHAEALAAVGLSE
jgi:hypothetical protein